MKLKIGEYGIWTNTKRIIIFRVSQIESALDDSWYISEALYDNECIYPRKRVHFLCVNDDNDIIKIDAKEVNDLIMVEVL